jgi:hypothetical protein
MNARENETAVTIDPELLQAFAETHYTVHHQPPFTLHIGQNSPELDALLKAGGHESAAFITAWNPKAQPLNDEENRTRQRQLTDEFRRRSLHCIEGIGEHASNGWPGEESALVFGLQPEAARALCDQFGQLACVIYQRGDAARLLIV